MQDDKSNTPPEDIDRLSDLLRMDTWTVHRGLTEITDDYIEQLSPDDRRDSLNLYFRLMDIWDSGNHPAEALPPAYFVEWARLKRYPLSWEPWALSNGWLDNRASVTNLLQVKNKAIAKRGIADAQKALSAAQDNEMPYMTSTLRAIAKVMRDNWADYCPTRLPKQDCIAREIDTALGTTPAGNKLPTRMASALATAIQPDEVKASDRRRNLKVL